MTSCRPSTAARVPRLTHGTTLIPPLPRHHLVHTHLQVVGDDRVQVGGDLVQFGLYWVTRFVPPQHHIVQVGDELKQRKQSQAPSWTPRNFSLIKQTLWSLYFPSAENPSIITQAQNLSIISYNGCQREYWLEISCPKFLWLKVLWILDPFVFWKFFIWI